MVYHRLRVNALSEIYDVGNSPLREVLNRLAASELIDRVDGKGFVVLMHPGPAHSDDMTVLL